VRDEKISLDYARREHGVVIDPVTLTVDAAATRAARLSASRPSRASSPR
jgi:hypothetical protein